MKHQLTRSLLSFGIFLMLSFNPAAAEPADWPSEYKWHEYSKTAEQPTSHGRVKTFLNGTKGDGVKFDSLPLQHAVVRVRGNGAQKIALVVDPLCPYSRQYERTINELDNVTIYTFIMPVLNKSPDSRNWQMTERILCEPDNQTRAETWEAWIVGGVSPPQVTGCSSAISAMLKAFQGARGHYTGSRIDSQSPVTMFDVLDLSYTGAYDYDFVETILKIAGS